MYSIHMYTVHVCCWLIQYIYTLYFSEMHNIVMYSMYIVNVHCSLISSFAPDNVLYSHVHVYMYVCLCVLTRLCWYSVVTLMFSSTIAVITVNTLDYSQLIE